jgi:hypothetical protein
MLPSSALPEGSKFARFGPKDTAVGQYVKLAAGSEDETRDFCPAFACHTGQNPYNAPIPWAPAGS